MNDENSELPPVSEPPPSEQSQLQVEPQVIRARDIPARWTCARSHVLGGLAQERLHGRIVTRLIVFRLAFDPDDPVNDEMILGKIDAGSVVCSKCGQVREWRAGDAVYRKVRKRNRNI